MKKFEELTFKLWKKFAVSGKFKTDKEGNVYINNLSDTDGEGALALLKMAGVDTSHVKYVAPGKHLEDYINIDTGNQDGVVASLDNKTAFFDHHGKRSVNDTSSTELVYKSLTGLGLLEKTPALDKAVKLITQEDNRSFPNEEKYFKEHWHHTVLGLIQYIQLPKLVKFFEEGGSPTDILNESQLQSLGLLEKSREVKKRVKASLEAMEQIRQKGFVLHSKKYGDIAVDIGKRANIGFVAAKALGMDGYIIWSPKTQSFFVSTNKPMDIKLAQGQQIRETMWIKPAKNIDGQDLEISLQDIVNELNGSVGDGLRKYLEKNK